MSIITDKYRLKARWRLFRIWQETGELPFRHTQEEDTPAPVPNGNNFFRGSFDSIPLLNNVAKRTMLHLLFRPGYMIRDYFRGKHEIYLAPLLSLLVFYAFFGTLHAVVHPSSRRDLSDIEQRMSVSTEEGQLDDDQMIFRKRANVLVLRAYIWLHLDQYPEQADTPAKASVAALESSLRAQGVQEFFSMFIIVWISMWLALRKRYKFGLSASATCTAYLLSLYSFFILIELLVGWGKKSPWLELSIIGILLTVIYHQLMEPSLFRSLRMAVRTLFFVGILIGLFALAMVAVLIWYAH